MRFGAFWEKGGMVDTLAALPMIFFA